MPSTEAAVSCTTSSGGPAPASPGQRDRISARTDVRASGGQPGNRNRWVHGKRTAGAVLRRKQGAAARKVAAAILAKLDLLPGYRCRPRPLREDQVPHLDPEALAVMRRLGVLEISHEPLQRHSAQAAIAEPI
jgi:hypothetical protein